MKPSGPSFFFLGSPNQPSTTSFPVPHSASAPSYHHHSLPRNSSSRTKLVRSPKSLDSAACTLARLHLSRDQDSRHHHRTSRRGHNSCNHHGSSGKVDGHTRRGNDVNSIRHRALSHSPSRRGSRHLSASSRSTSPKVVNIRAPYPSVILRTIIQQGRLQQQQQRRQEQQQQQQGMNAVKISWLEDTDGHSAEEDDDGIGLDLEEYHRQRKMLEQRLLDRGEAAERSRSSFLKARRHSAAYVVQHAKMVAQRQQAELEVKRRHLGDEMNRKMMLAFTRKKAHLQASRENDPSRRHHHRKKGLSVPTSLPVSGVTAAAVSSSSSSPVLDRKGSLTATTKAKTAAIVSSPKNRSELLHPRTTSVVRGESDDRKNEEDEQHKTAIRKGMTRTSGHTFDQGRSKSNSTIDQSKKGMFLVKSDSRLYPKQPTDAAGADPPPPSCLSPRFHSDDPRLEWATLWVQRQRRDKAVHRSMRLFQRAIGHMGGASTSTAFITPKAMLALSYDALVQRMITKDLQTAATRLLEHAAALARIDARLQHRRPVPRRVLRNPARVFLSAFLVIAHPDHLRTPLMAPQMQAQQPMVHDASDDGFQALVDAAKHLLESLETWFRSSLFAHQQQEQLQQQQQSSNETTQTDTAMLCSALNTTECSIAQQFDQAWAVYYDLMSAWKTRDLQNLVHGLVAHAQQIEALWAVVRQDPSAENEWRPRLEAQRADLQAKARQIGGQAAEARVLAVWQGTSSANDALEASGVREGHQPVRAHSSDTTITEISQIRSAPITPPLAVELASSSLPMEDVITATATNPVIVSGGEHQRNDSANQAMSVDPPLLMLRSSSNNNVNVTEPPSSINPSQQGNQQQQQPPNPKDVSTSMMTEGGEASTKATRERVSLQSNQAKDMIGKRMPSRMTTNEVDKLLTSFDKPNAMTNVQLLHEIALNPRFNLEPSITSEERSAQRQQRRQQQAQQQSQQQQEEQQRNAATDLMRSAKAMMEGGGQQAVEAFQTQVQEMAIKAVFSAIERDTEEGNLAQWIPVLLAAIRDRLLELTPEKTSIYREINEKLDPVLVHQQVARGVFDVESAMHVVLDVMARLCAPVRDPEIKAIKDSLETLLTATSTPQPPPLPQPPTAQESDGSSNNSGQRVVVQVRTRVLVDCLRSIMELLDEMLLDMARFRITAMRPYLRKQAIPYEHQAFKTALENKEKDLVITKSWLTHAAQQVVAQSGIASSSLKSSNPPSRPPTAGSKSGMQHHRIFTHGYLNLLFARVPLYPGLSLPETFDLDAMRIESLQNQLRGISFVAVLMQVAKAYAPRLGSSSADVGGVGQQLKERLLDLMRRQTTTLEQLQEAIIEAVEMEAHHYYQHQKQQQLVQQQQQPRHSPSTSPSPPPPVSEQQLLTDEQRSMIANTVGKVLSFDDPIYHVITKNLREMLQTYLEALHANIGSGHSDQMGAQGGGDLDMLGGDEAGPLATTTAVTEKGGQPKVVLKDPSQLQRIGLGDVAYELLPIVSSVRVLARYNAEVYKDWYDEILKGLLTALQKSTPTSTVTSAALKSSAQIPSQGKDQAQTQDLTPTLANSQLPVVNESLPVSQLEPQAQDVAMETEPQEEPQEPLQQHQQQQQQQQGDVLPPKPARKKSVNRKKQTLTTESKDDEEGRQQQSSHPEPLAEALKPARKKSASMKKAMEDNETENKQSKKKESKGSDDGDDEGEVGAPAAVKSIAAPTEAEKPKRKRAPSKPKSKPNATSSLLPPLNPEPDVVSEPGMFVDVQYHEPALVPILPKPTDALDPSSNIVATIVASRHLESLASVPQLAASTTTIAPELEDVEMAHSTPLEPTQHDAQEGSSVAESMSDIQQPPPSSS